MNEWSSSGAHVELMWRSCRAYGGDDCGTLTYHTHRPLLPHHLMARGEGNGLTVFQNKLPAGKHRYCRNNPKQNHPIGSRAPNKCNVTSRASWGAGGRSFHVAARKLCRYCEMKFGGRLAISWSTAGSHRRPVSLIADLFAWWVSVIRDTIFGR